MSIERAQQIADTVLAPGRGVASCAHLAGRDAGPDLLAGVLAPCGYALRGGADPWEMQCECLLVADRDATLDLRVRARRRMAGRPDGGQGPEVRFEASGIPIALLLGSGLRWPWSVPAGAQAINVVIAMDAVLDDGWVRLRTRIENHTAWPADAPPQREPALHSALIGTHALIAAHGARFLSLAEPPSGASAAAARCRNLQAWPVLVGAEGDDDVLLASPLVLDDYPARERSTV